MKKRIYGKDIKSICTLMKMYCKNIEAYIVIKNEETKNKEDNESKINNLEISLKLYMLELTKMLIDKLEKEKTLMSISSNYVELTDEEVYLIISGYEFTITILESIEQYGVLNDTRIIYKEVIKDLRKSIEQDGGYQEVGNKLMYNWKNKSIEDYGNINTSELIVDNEQLAKESKDETKQIEKPKTGSKGKKAIVFLTFVIVILFSINKGITNKKIEEKEKVINFTKTYFSILDIDYKVYERYRPMLNNTNDEEFFAQSYNMGLELSEVAGQARQHVDEVPGEIKGLYDDYVQSLYVVAGNSLHLGTYREIKYGAEEAIQNRDKITEEIINELAKLGREYNVTSEDINIK